MNLNLNPATVPSKKVILKNKHLATQEQIDCYLKTKKARKVKRAYIHKDTRTLYIVYLTDSGQCVVAQHNKEGVLKFKSYYQNYDSETRKPLNFLFNREY